MLLSPTRVKGALTPYERDGLTAAHYEGAAPLTPIGVKLPADRDTRLAATLTRAQALAPARHTLTVRQGSFQAFVRLSDREQRPVEDVMQEWLADCANLIRSQEADDEFDGYGDARPCTPAMRAAAAASDERERHPRPDDEEAARAHGALGAGYVELTLATEGC